MPVEHQPICAIRVLAEHLAPPSCRIEPHDPAGVVVGEKKSLTIPRRTLGQRERSCDFFEFPSSWALPSNPARSGHAAHRMAESSQRSINVRIVSLGDLIFMASRRWLLSRHRQRWFSGPRQDDRKTYRRIGCPGTVIPPPHIGLSGSLLHSEHLPGISTVATDSGRNTAAHVVMLIRMPITVRDVATIGRLSSRRMSALGPYRSAAVATSAPMAPIQ